MNNEIKIAVIFGEYAVDTYYDNGLEALMEFIEEGNGIVVMHTFNTDDEKKAYVRGLWDGQGYADYAIMDDEDMEKIGEIREEEMS